MISNIQSQLKNDDVDIIYFDDKKEHGIEKLKVDIDEIVVNYLKNFENCYTLNELRQALNKNNVHAETNTPFNLKYAYQFFNNMYNLYSNDILIRDLSEDELSIYVWSSLINHVFIKIGYNIKFSSGELSSQSFENLKKLAQLSGPKLDSKATMMSVDAEILLHESSKKDVPNKRINDCKKLEYCSKVLLASAFLELPTSSRSDIHKFETYMIQTNGLKLTLSVAHYLFEDTICIFDPTDIVIPKTVEAFPKSPSVHNKQLVEVTTKQNFVKIPSKSLSTTTTKTTNKNSTTTIVVDSIKNSVIKDIKQDEQEIVEVPISEPFNSFLNLNTHDTITPLNINMYTCPNCHTPNSVNAVKDDNYSANGDFYTCLSHGNYGCGWEGEHLPNEENIAKHVFSIIGFKPLIIN
ncbi:7333_t:CDS:2 [Entrophospora sp. SA101]|nr:7333_t:CDS:2 [Entrophospora sp. SA101]